MRTLIALLFAGLAAAHADPYISEFMASNKNGIVDADGDHPDWIEIHNPDAVPSDLTGWYLTDSAGNLTKWKFPETSIPAGGYLLVFASSKDRRVSGQRLHTNFALSADGEYLGLIKPDGVTKAAEFAPKFPAQFEDISYGISSPVSTVAYCKQGTPAKCFVPLNNALATAWRATGFDDSGWASGVLSAGFFNYSKASNPDLSSSLGTNIYSAMAGKSTSAYLRVEFNVPDPAKVLTLRLRINYDDGFAAYVNGQAAASGNAPATQVYNSVALGVHNPVAFEEFNLDARIPQLVAGKNVLAIHGLNESLGSSDFYALPELSAVVDTGAAPVTGFFTTATPEARNGGAESVQLPQKVAFSRASGPFTTAFSLTLSGANANQQIRYVIADPSASPGAQVAEPALDSALYAGPIAISSNKLIRAAVFDASTGQRGAVTTVHYALLETGATNNTSNFTSNLPILVADDHGAGQPVDSSSGTYTTSMVYIFPPVNGTAAINSTPAVATRAGLRVRGRSSQGFPKKSYGMETWNEVNDDLKMPLLGLAKESDWILNGPWNYDDTYIHNAFMYELSRQVGYWAPRTQFVEMFTNSNGGKLDYTDYAGVYVLTEKIESGADRLDITEIAPGDVGGDAVTGGYIFKWDQPDADEVSWKTTRGIPSEDSSNVIVEPDADDDTSEQVDYLKNYIQSFENALFTDRASGFATRNYRKYIDVRSWVDYHIFQMLSMNVDAVRLSSFFHKDRNAKIMAGPLWDFDRTLGSDNGTDANPMSWGDSSMQNRFFAINWWGQLFKDPDFVQAWVDRWWELRAGPFANANLLAIVTSLGAQIGNAAGARDAARWPDNAAAGGIYSNEITAMKNWLTAGRAPWIDSQMPVAPSASVASGVVAAGTTVTLSGTGSIRYKTDGGDPRAAGGGASLNVATYSTPIAINQTTVLTSRRFGTFAPFPLSVSTTWSAPLRRVYLVDEAFAIAGDIAVSEISYDPAVPTAGELANFPGGLSGGDFEFLELRNIGNRTVNTFEMTFAADTPFSAIKLDPLSLAPGETALVVKNREAFLARYGSALASRVVGEWRDGSLSNDGEEIRLLARDGSVVQSLTYQPSATGGRSLNLSGTSWLAEAPSPGSQGPTLAQWMAFHFPAGTVNTTDDPDADGLDNATEYTRATDPVAPDAPQAFSTRLVLAASGGSGFRLSFDKPALRPSALYQVKQSSNLDDWAPLADTLQSIQGNVEKRIIDGQTDAALQCFRLDIGIAQ
jgi:hypothetical protein